MQKFCKYVVSSANLHLTSVARKTVARNFSYFEKNINDLRFLSSRERIMMAT